jgi:uncharacterized protein (DUF58 family)
MHGLHERPLFDHVIEEILKQCYRKRTRNARDWLMVTWLVTIAGRRMGSIVIVSSVFIFLAAIVIGRSFLRIGVAYHVPHPLFSTFSVGPVKKKNYLPLHQLQF